MTNINLKKLDAAAFAAELRVAQRANDWAAVGRIIKALETGPFGGDPDRVLRALLEGEDRGGAKRSIIEKADEIQTFDLREEIGGMAGVILDEYDDDQIREADAWDDLPDVFGKMRETISGSWLTFDRTAARRVARYIEGGDSLEEAELESELAHGDFTGLARAILEDAVLPPLEELFDARREALLEEQDED